MIQTIYTGNAYHINKTYTVKVRASKNTVWSKRQPNRYRDIWKPIRQSRLDYGFGTSYFPDKIPSNLSIFSLIPRYGLRKANDPSISRATDRVFAMVGERENSLLATYWSESTESSR